MLGLKSREKPLAVVGALRQSVLAWVGALSVIQEGFEGWAKQLIERGELAESEGRQFITQLVTQHRNENSSSKEATKTAHSSIREKLMDWCLARMGRPTNKETRELSQRISALEARIAELAAL
ncbi:MAG: phasin family protein [Planctomycetota bacterium]|nr:phasin family protein [Planctomycetota bacterium]